MHELFLDTPVRVLSTEKMLGLIPSIYDPFFAGDVRFFVIALEESTFLNHCGISGAFCWGFMRDELEFPDDEDELCANCGACENNEVDCIHG